jgi:hypothetical protein
LVVTFLSHRCNSRTDASHTASLHTACLKGTRNNVLEETPYSWQPKSVCMGQGLPGRPNSPLTRTTLGQLCAASWVSRSWPDATQHRPG